jgi:hypothetical protein
MRNIYFWHGILNNFDKILKFIRKNGSLWFAQNKRIENVHAQFQFLDGTMNSWCEDKRNVYGNVVHIIERCHLYLYDWLKLINDKCRD